MAGESIIQILIKALYDGKGLQQAQKDLGGAEKEVSSFGKTVRKVVPSSVLQFATVAGAVTAAGAAIWSTTQAFSDLNESVNKTDVVFGSSAQQIHDWSSTTAESIGISKQAAEEAAGTYGNLFTSLGITQTKAAQMSTSLVQLAADMASFNNANPEDVLLALRSGLSGEIEPLKKYGIAMNEAILKQKAMQLGLGDNIQKLTEAEKIQVRYAVILDQTANAQGDFARTSDGLANSQRQLNAEWSDLKANLGEEVYPAVLKVVTVLKDAVAAQVSFSNEQKKLEAQGATPYEAHRLALIGFTHASEDASQAAEDTSAALDEETQKAAEAGASFDKKFTPYVKDAAGAQKEAEQAAKDLSDAYKGLLGNMDQIHDANKRFAESSQNLKDQEKDIRDQIVQENVAYGQLLQTGKQTQDQIDEHIRKNADLQKQLQDNSDAQQKLTQDTQEATKQRIYDAVQEGLAKDGINSQEFAFLEQLKVQQGLITQAEADRAIAERAAADQIIGDYEKQNAVTDETQKKLDALVNGSPYNVVINIETQGSIPSISAGPTIHTQPSAFVPSQPGHGFGAINRDSGGRGYPGNSYLIGVGAQPEVFVPDQVGSFYPNRRASSQVPGSNVTLNMNIENIRSLSDIDYLVQRVQRKLTQGAA